MFRSRVYVENILEKIRAVARKYYREREIV